MSDINPISFPPAGTLTGTNTLAINQGGVWKSVSLTNLNNTPSVTKYCATVIVGVLDTSVGHVYMHSNGQLRLYGKNAGNFAGLRCENTDTYADLSLQSGGGTTYAKLFGYGNFTIATGPTDDGLHRLQVGGAVKADAAMITTAYPNVPVANRTLIDYYTGARFISTGPTPSTYSPIMLHQKSSDGSLFRDAVTVDASGNAKFIGNVLSGSVGIGTNALNPAWGSNWSGTEVGSTYAFYATKYLYLHHTTNCYYDGTNWIRQYGAASTKYSQDNGNHIWSVAAAATGGTSFNWTDTLILDSAGYLYPGADNAQTFGTASKRWSTIYAVTGTINTSDAREKTAIVPLTAEEIAASKELVKEIGTYQFLSAIALKGEELARRHVGLTVQRAIEIMQAHNLDPFKYGFICHDEWGESQSQEAGDRYGFRTEELLLFLLRGFEARIAALELA